MSTTLSFQPKTTTQNRTETMLSTTKHKGDNEMKATGRAQEGV